PLLRRSEFGHGCIAPKPLELVELARRRMEDVDDEIDVVDEHPSASAHPLHAERPIPLFSKLFDEVVGYRGDVRVGATRCDQEEVRGTAKGPQVEECDVLRLAIQKQV